MGLNPQHIRSVTFKTVKKGLDPDEVQSFLASVAEDLERAQNHAAAMEARARAAVQRVQELTPDHTSQSPPADAAPMISASVDESETITRTLLLAQRTADMTISEAEAEAEALLEKATENAARELDAARELSTQMAESARSNARQIGESERNAADEELRDLQQRHATLSSDVTELERFLGAQRDRLRDAASSLVDLTERIPGGLGVASAPVPLTPVEEQTAYEFNPDDDTEDLVVVADLADDAAEPDESSSRGPVDVDDTTVMDIAGDPTPVDRQIWSPDDDSATGADGESRFDFTDDR